MINPDEPAAAAPVIAVLMPVFRPPARYLRLAIASVRQQTLDDWQLILVDDASEDPDVRAVLDAAALDPRVTVVVLAENRGISGASNAGLELVTAPLVALLDHDDALEPTALAEVVAASRRSPTAEVLYTDRDAVDEEGVTTETFRKPDWAPERLRGNMYVAHLTSVSTEAAREVGGFRTEYDGAQDHDLVLRITERGAPVVHIPKVLYHWRQLPSSTARDPRAKPHAALRGRDAVAAHLQRTGVQGEVRTSPFPGFYLVDRVPAPTFASIVIPTRGSRSSVGGRKVVMVAEAVASIVAHDYRTDYELVVVHDTDADPAYLADLRALAGDRLRVVDYAPPFNFSAKVNRGVEASVGEVVVMLNDDISVVTPNWLDQLVALAQGPDVGAVGAKLLFEDGSIQHAGHRYINGHIGHVGAGRRDGPGYFGENLIDREVVGVTAACLVQRRSVFDHLAGLDETLPGNFNDVDYCLRMRAKGYRIVQANSVVLHHYESRTRKSEVASWEFHRIMARLGSDLEDDPFTSHDDDWDGYLQRRTVAGVDRALA